MATTRRAALAALAASTLMSAQEDEQENNPHRPPIPPDPEQDTRLPNGKSQKDEIAKQEHEQALKDADQLMIVAKQLRQELEKSGDYVVSMSSVKKTEEIERLARKIRGRLKQ